MIQVTVKLLLHGKQSMQVEYNDKFYWVPYKDIEDDSEIYERTPVGFTGVLVLEDEKASLLNIQE